MENLIPLSHLVLEGFGNGDANHLAHELAGEVFVDSIGRRAITEERAATLFAERSARQAALEAADAARRANQPDPMAQVRERVQRIQRQQPQPGQTAYETMLSAEYHDDRRNTTLDENFSGQSYYHSVSEKG